MLHSDGRGAPVVLVVEDEVFVRIDIADQLRNAGFQVLEAESGESAMDVANDGRPVDVVFTDLRLGGKLNGWDVGEAFRSKRPGIGVIYASGAPIDPPRAVANSRFFAKPYQPGEIVEACRQLSGAFEPARAAFP